MDEHYFFLAFNFDPVTGEPVVYRPRCEDPEDIRNDDYIYAHFFRCIKEYSYIQGIPPMDISKEIFGDMYYGVTKGEE